LARARRLLGNAHWRSGAYDLAIESLGHARAIQETLGDHWELARVCGALAGIAYEQGHLETARLQAHEALRLYEASNDRWSIAAIRGNLGLVYRRLGRFDLALQHNGYDLEMSREMGDPRAVAIALGNRGMIYLESGDLDQALACLEEARHNEVRLGNSWDAARHQAVIARVHQLRGEGELALAHLGQALPVLRAHGAPYYIVLPLLYTAELHFSLGRTEEAASLAQEALALAEDRGMRDEALRALELAAEIAGKREAAAERL
jgi:tetratricopeptide (TPR) repeat protein